MSWNKILEAGARTPVQYSREQLLEMDKHNREEHKKWLEEFICSHGFKGDSCPKIKQKGGCRSFSYWFAKSGIYEKTMFIFTQILKPLGDLSYKDEVLE